MENTETFLLVVIVVLIVWVAILSFFLHLTIRHYNKLVKGTDKKTLKSILDTLIEDLTRTKKNVKGLDKRLEAQEKASQFHLSKIGLNRFNPFADTGGEQSFTVSLLDLADNGIVITSLQGRSGTRWYAKEVKRGKGIKFDLSKEEQEAVKQAKALS